MNIDIYVIKSDHLKERCQMLPHTLENINTIIRNNKFTVKTIYITSPSIHDIESNLEFYNANINLNNDDIIDPDFKKVQNKFSLAQLSNLYKHRKAYEIIKTSKTKHNYIIEDDIILLKEYTENFNEFFSVLPTLEYDIILTCLSNNTGGKKIDILASTVLFKILLTKSSYLITPLIAEKLYDYLNVVRFPIKLSLSKFLFDNKNTINSYILNKHTLFEGSKLGLFTTSVNGSNNLIQNNCYIELLHMANNDKIDLKETENYYNNFGKNNPDFQHIMGLIYYKCNKLEESTEMLKSAVINFKNKDGYMVQYNEILNNCINIYQYYQDDIKDCFTKKGLY